jgi:hypothetical protein
LKFHSHIEKACQPGEPKHAWNPAKVAKIPTNYHESRNVYDEGDAIGDAAGSNWILDHGSAPGEEVVEKRKARRIVPYQLQRWAFETSNANISLAERLEKLKY